MHVRPIATESPAAVPDRDADPELLAADDQQAVADLVSAFKDSRPVALVTDRGRIRSERVILRFLGTTAEDVTRIRLEEPCSDSLALLTGIVRAIGFKTKDFALRDLESIFRMFLSFQRTHRRRTVVWIQDPDRYAAEALGKVFEFIDLEPAERYGLFFVLAGAPELTESRDSNLLDAIVERAGEPIEIAPLAPEQARAFVMQQVESRDFADATLVIDSEAIARLHEISEGICDTLSGLCDLSLKIAEDASEFPVTASIVGKAASELGLRTDHRDASAEDETVAEEFFATDTAGKLVVRKSGELLCEFLLESDIVTIGRDKHNTLTIPSLYVSRHHALVTRGEAGVLVQDLGSTNGTVVNGRRIQTQMLEGGDAIVLGDCRIEYVAAPSIADQLVAAEIIELNRDSEKRTGTHGQ